MTVDILLDEVSPYRSRRVTVVSDAHTTRAHLRDPRGEILVPVWLANHIAAPAVADPTAPGNGTVVPARHTKHPKGHPPIPSDRLRAVWFEEGDGVALLEEDSLLAVIPGWAEAEVGLPGYAREAVGRSTHAWALDDVAQRLWPRVEHADAYWQWREAPGSSRTVQRTVFSHLSRTIGPGDHYWDVSDGQPPLICVSERPATSDRDYTVVSTVGMCGQRMPTLDRYMAESASYARVELAMATTLPADRAAHVFRWLGVFPWRAVTWFGPGHSVKWFQGEDGSGLSHSYAAALLITDPTVLPGPAAPDTSGLEFHGDPVRWLWVVPITRPEHVFAKEHDAATLLDKLAAEGRSWVLH